MKNTMFESELIKYGNVEVCCDIKDGSLYGGREIEVIYDKYSGEFELIVQ